jgi:hypothetical protein
MGRVEIDRAGFRKQFDGKDKSWILHELLQNACDEDGVTTVGVIIEPVPHKREILIEVTDDSPHGFRRLADAYTLWTESLKVNDASKAGRFNERFNEGDKKVILYAEWAKIETTKGTIEFRGDERIESGPIRAVGSRISVAVKGLTAEREEMIAGAMSVIPPDGIVITVNGTPLDARKPDAVFEWTLPTVQGPELRPTQRKTEVRIYRPRSGEVSRLYECGIPVVETGDAYHVNVMQRVPLNRERDNVTPAYLRLIRAMVLNSMHGSLPEEEFTKPWVAQAVTHEKTVPEAVNSYLDAKYTPNRVSFDPTSPESNSQAMASGTMVVFGRNEPKEVWEKARSAGLIQSSSQMFPVHVERYERDKFIDEDKWTDGMRNIANYSKWVAREAVNRGISVSFINDSSLSILASYGGSGQLTYNVGRLGYAFFDGGPSYEVDKLLIHELGHDPKYGSGDHLSSAYYECLCRVGAKLKELALRYPDKMKEFGWHP